MSIQQRIGFSLFAVLALISSGSAFAFPNAADMQANYQACEKSSADWHRNWGQYVVAYDLNDAVNTCRHEFPEAQPRLVGCSINGQNVWAGYACEPISGANYNN
jgi:hypothetical protein